MVGDERDGTVIVIFRAKKLLTNLSNFPAPPEKRAEIGLILKIFLKGRIDEHRALQYEAMTFEHMISSDSICLHVYTGRFILFLPSNFEAIENNIIIILASHYRITTDTEKPTTITIALALPITITLPIPIPITITICLKIFDLVMLVYFQGG